ncbi:MAG: response regulator [Bacteroidota bacterium]
MKKTILLIEDNPEILDNTIELLEMAGYDIIAAKNGEEGVNFAAEHQPNLIISDILMPRLDGYQVLRKVKDSIATASIPFVFLSASAQQVDIEKGKMSGADAYLVKPFSLEELKAVIERLI